MLYKVYALIDDDRCILGVQSDLFGSVGDGWTLIDEGAGDRFMHASGSYLEKPATDERGVSRYRVVDDESAPFGIAIVERTQEEMDASYTEPEVQPSDKERIAALEAQLAAYEAAYAEGVHEA